jgi:hypothetical protein
MAAFAAACAMLGAPAAAGELPPDEALAVINAVRQQVAECASRSPGLPRMQPVGTASPSSRPALAWNPQLAAAAEQHARAMAEQNFFDHTDPQGRGVAQRATAAGYRWRMVGENLAAGQRTLEDALRGWVLSESHCRNLLDERFVEVGLARVASTRSGDRYRVYWAMVLGRPTAPIRTAMAAATEVGATP